ncbi:MAG: hypothetical protein HOC79_08150 [Euryarchaeota archaeon]|nr:hypothetical protein [Euryarchaeota archaeon]
MTKSYPRRCRFCAVMINMLECNDGIWRAFDFPENTSSGSWEIHYHRREL